MDFADKYGAFKCRIQKAECKTRADFTKNTKYEKGNAEVSDGGGREMTQSPNARRSPPFAP